MNNSLQTRELPVYNLLQIIVMHKYLGPKNCHDSRKVYKKWIKNGMSEKFRHTYDKYLRAPGSFSKNLKNFEKELGISLY